MLCMQKIMIDPVVASDGITYERQSIQKWMDDGNDFSPWGNQRLDDNTPTPNSLVLGLISQFNLA